jgi:hypothetical protein
MRNQNPHTKKRVVEDEMKRLALSISMGTLQERGLCGEEQRGAGLGGHVTT